MAGREGLVDNVNDMRPDFILFLMLWDHLCMAQPTSPPTIRVFG